MTFINIPYELEKKDVPLPVLHSIWNVHADKSYDVSKRDGFEFPCLFITYDGNGSVTLANHTYELQKNTFFFVEKGIPAMYKCLSNDWKFYFLDFNQLNMTQYLQLPVREVISTGKIAEAMQLCERMIDSLIVQNIGYEYASNILLQEIILLFTREHTVVGLTYHTELNKILIYMHRNLDKQIRIEDLLQLSGWSRTTFFSRFRTLTGLSPTDYLLKLKLASARVFLETTSLSLKEIAVKLQFYDEFHFSKLFKKAFGQSPSTYRKLKVMVSENF
ncbi:AraC family transcriptional regulator [Paenibacillus roseipurpureus]|uniref:AraC family transcriptional regulator n=1 Tax=Paenibacillus roseopurpureus TaxID=2918901 RepID=A0AA96RMT4_9BACL|nr:AraC family transcriptional regulator [Paenibacillus sp. MBLB1832]WNR46821.1 AraC family transcriptional regulator [Paenibacillus sp. MBLB1832]